MTQTFTLHVISPSSEVLNAPALLVEVPGKEGDFGVLAGHAPFLSMLRPGVIKATLGDNEVKRFFATSGYADVTPAGVTILSDHIQDLEFVDAVDAKEALVAAQRDLDAALDESERTSAQRRIEAAQALLHALHAA
jgi:F-type H+-transporting ATPase subunit epsilon